VIEALYTAAEEPALQTKPVEFCAKADAARSGTKARLDSLPIIAAEVWMKMD